MDGLKHYSEASKTLKGFELSTQSGAKALLEFEVEGSHAKTMSGIDGTCPDLIGAGDITFE